MDATHPQGLLDLNLPADVDVEMQDNVAEVIGKEGQVEAPLYHHGIESGGVGSEIHIAASYPKSNTIPSTDTRVGTGQTISSQSSASDDEVQSTQSSQNAPKTPYPGMIFKSWQEAKLHYNKYAKHVGFSIKRRTSQNSTLDKLKDKYLFVCNKNGKNDDINHQEAPLVRQRNCSITKRIECRARLRVKRIGAKWHVTMFIEDHTHELIKKII